MKAYNKLRNKKFYASIGLFLGSLVIPSNVPFAVSSGILAYFSIERFKLVEMELHPEIIERKLRLAELLKHHLLKSDKLSRWIDEETLMIAKPFTSFPDQRIVGWVSNRLKYDLWKSQNFFMEAQWKDAKNQGEGMSYCIGKFTSLNTYYFSKIIVVVTKPRPEEYVILDDITIDID